MNIRSPFPSCFCFAVFGDVVAGADYLATVETEVGLFVPERGAVRVFGDIGVVCGEALFRRLLASYGGCGEAF
jgi:hypothetical protein